MIQKIKEWLSICNLPKGCIHDWKYYYTYQEVGYHMQRTSCRKCRKCDKDEKLLIGFSDYLDGWRKRY